ncbi:hypothetical protein [Pararobbsia alpina]|uniref:Phage tail protein n=1 Tax=Pararobbsia alpina TaxID=621374 RepID=A0A6S7BAC9_9BURK|nr:hypothetical protein [Pararobbsia alpina]CAB3784332.1 hypothetical protein LMG28138_01788 [Pararobbsia alpina]
MPIFQFDQLNLAGTLAPGVYTQVVAPPAVVAGVSTNGLGHVGVASWGPVNSPVPVGSPQMAALMLGPVTVRKSDLATAIAVAFGLKQTNNTTVRVTDGSDTAATCALKDGSGTTGATLTGFYTGVVGNGLTATPAAGTKPNTFKCTVALPGFTSEVYDNLGVGIIPGSTTPGTGYTSVPSVAVSAPQTAGGTQAVMQATLKVLSANVTGGGATGGTGYVTGDTLTLANGVVLTATASAGVITALSVTNAGSLGGGSAPTAGNVPIQTSGVGAGAIINLVWGLGAPAVIQPGAGYTSATATLSGGGAGTGGAYTLGTGCWTNLVSAINNGQSGVRGPSQYVVATLGTSAAAPALATTAFSGGTDGAAGVTDATLVGANTTPPTGMSALQNAGVLTMNLVDHSTSSQWSTMAQFGITYGIFGAGQGSPGQSIATVAANLATAGVDNYSFKDLVGDWVYWNDTVNGVQRLLGPATFWAPMRANLSPNQSTLNKPVNGIIGTQRSIQSLVYSSPEALAATQGRVDYLANPSPGGNYFSFQTDMNTSSFAATNSEAYTTMTNFLALTLASNFGWVVGNPQTTDLRGEVNDAITGFLMNLWKNPTLQYIGDVNNPKSIPFSVQTNGANNPDPQVALGLMQTLVKVKYLSIVRVFVISLQGGSTVNVTVQPA